MRKMILLSLLSASVLVSGCAGNYERHIEQPLATEEIGRDYLIVYGFSLPARDNMPAVHPTQLSLRDVADMRDLNRQCHQVLAPQIPSAAKEIGAYTARQGVGSAIGTGLGAIAAFTGVGFLSYAAYGGLAGLGSAMPSGVHIYNVAVRYARYACMQFAITQMQRHGRLRGIGVIPWAGVGRANAPDLSRAIATPTGEMVMPLQQQPDFEGSDPLLLPPM